MGRSPCCCHEAGVKKGPWTEDEDRALVEHIQKQGGHVSRWRDLPRAAGLNRCGKSCRLRWTNYLRPDIKRGNFTDDEERLVITLHAQLGNRWSTIATHLEGRTDNEIKNHWNTHIRKKLLRMGIDPVTHQRLPPDDSFLGGGGLASPKALLCAAASLGGLDAALRQAQVLQLQLLLQVIGSSNNVPSAGSLIAGNYNHLLGNGSMLSAGLGLAPNFQDNQPTGGYLGDTANFAEQAGMLQQHLKASGSVVCSPSDEPADQYHNTAALAGPAYPQELVAGDTPALQGFAELLEPVELPSLCSLEGDSFWKDMLADNSFPSLL